MSEALRKILAEGIVKELPECELCGMEEKEQKETQGKPFLILIYDKLVCGYCAVKIWMGKQCLSCNTQNIYISKFCCNCGADINQEIVQKVKI